MSSTSTSETHVSALQNTTSQDHVLRMAHSSSHVAFSHALKVTPETSTPPLKWDAEAGVYTLALY